MSRVVSHFDLDGARLQGTYHSAAEGSTASGERVGVLFTNAGLLPRSARGDLATKFADTFSEWGYPCFRFDLPGLGDSSGDVPAEILEFYEWVQEGRFAGVTLKLAKAICERHQLSGIILFGHCGSATTAAFTAMRDEGGLIKGLVLLDPSFILYKAATAPVNPGAGGAKAKPAATAAPANPGAIKRLMKKVQQFRQKFVQTKAGFALKTAWRRTKKMALKFRGSVLPENANMPLIRGWLQFGAQGLPLLAFHADRGDRVIAFDYLHYLETKSKGAIRYTSVKGTNHSFVEGPGPEAIRGGVRDWLGRHFPIAEKQNTMKERPQRTTVTA